MFSEIEAASHEHLITLNNTANELIQRWHYREATRAHWGLPITTQFLCKLVLWLLWTGNDNYLSKIFS